MFYDMYEVCYYFLVVKKTLISKIENICYECCICYMSKFHFMFYVSPDFVCLRLASLTVLFSRTTGHLWTKEGTAARFTNRNKS